MKYKENHFESFNLDLNSMKCLKTQSYNPWYNLVVCWKLVCDVNITLILIKKKIDEISCFVAFKTYLFSPKKKGDVAMYEYTLT